MSCDEDSTNSANTWNSEKESDSIKKEGYEEDISPKKDIVDAKVNEDQISVYDCMEYDNEEDSGLAAFGISDSEDTVLDQLHSGLNHKAKRKLPLGPVELHLKCEWKNCAYETEQESKYHVHVSYHIPDLEVKTLGNGEEVYMCLWNECNFLTGGVKEIQRHVTYHSYHTKLKSIGSHVIKEWNLPKCMYGTETRNMIPEKIDPMVCEWNDCNKEFNNVQVFLYHIQMHVNENFVEFEAKSQNSRCKWEGCTLNTQKITRTSLTNHVRTHTQEKVVGCPICGHLFSTNTKLIDHCERQLPRELSEFQCSHCYKHFPSLRLLKDHMRGHVNFYKCCYCDMTCSSRHTFSAHIRYKHLDSKPFKCSECDYACKTHHDLKAHMSIHDTKPQFECEVAGCEFSCRAKQTLQRHLVDNHNASSSPVYSCHLPDCNSKYKRGCYLTKHLMNKHCLRWPSGHSKFMYHRQEDGSYRLQTVRYESIKLCGENKSLDLPSKSNFKLTPEPGEGTRSFKVSPVESESDSSTSQVLISIEDESGNTINCCTIPEVVGDIIPKNATVIATANNDSDTI